MSVREHFRGCLIGLAVGDSLGAPVEGMNRTAIKSKYVQVTEMLGGGWLGLAPGEYTDDTAMMLCLAKSIVERGQFDTQNVASHFLGWFRAGPVGIGRTTWLALNELDHGASWQEAGKRAHEMLNGLSAGNGSIMRCAPLGLLHCRDREALIKDSIESSLITHYDPEACWGAVAVNLAVAQLLNGEREDLIARLSAEIEQPRVKEALARVSVLGLDQLRTSAYVLDTLQAALWCFLNTGSLEQAVIAAVNLGGDADTTGAVTGALAGAYWGLPQIPQRWLEPLKDRNEIIRLADEIHELAHADQTKSEAEVTGSGR